LLLNFRYEAMEEAAVHLAQECMEIEEIYVKLKAENMQNVHNGQNFK